MEKGSGHKVSNQEAIFDEYLLGKGNSFFQWSDTVNHIFQDRPQPQEQLANKMYLIFFMYAFYFFRVIFYVIGFCLFVFSFCEG